MFFLLTVLLIITGCSQRELTFDLTYLDTTRLVEFREKRQLEFKEEIRNLPKKIMETSAAPRNIEISIGNMLIPLIANQYCWDINYLECERITPVHPPDIRNLHIEILNTSTNGLISVSVAQEPIYFSTPVRIEVYFDENRNLKLFQALDSTSNKFDIKVQQFLFK